MDDDGVHRSLWQPVGTLKNKSRMAAKNRPLKLTMTALTGTRLPAGHFSIIFTVTSSNEDHLRVTFCPPGGRRPGSCERSVPHEITILLHLASIIIAAPLALAQQTTATLLGTVSDSSGAVVPGATIRVTNLANQVSRETKSDDSGAYSLPFLPSGEYSVSATADGFKVQKVDRVILGVQQTGRVDLKLELGEVTQTIDVEGGGLLLQTETSTVGTVIDSTKIVELPLNGRNFVQLAQLIPGVQAGTPGSITVRRGRGSIGQTDSPFGSTAMSANGSRDTANRYFMDGIEMMDYDAMTYSFSPSIDSLAEFKVETSTYSSELGGAPGGQINMITRSGTSAYHGTLWEFNRNDALTQVYDAIAQKDVDPPRLNRNQFGANVGGSGLPSKVQWPRQDFLLL